MQLLLDVLLSHFGGYYRTDYSILLYSLDFFLSDSVCLRNTSLTAACIFCYYEASSVGWNEWGIWFRAWGFLLAAGSALLRDFGHGVSPLCILALICLPRCHIVLGRNSSPGVQILLPYSKSLCQASCGGIVLTESVDLFLSRKLHLQFNTKADSQGWVFWTLWSMYIVGAVCT